MKELKPFYIFVKIPNYSGCSPDTTVNTPYTPPQKKTTKKQNKTKQKEKLAQLYPKTLSHFRLHQLEVLIDSEER